MNRRAILAGAALAALCAVALAKTQKLKIKKLGGAQITWNAVTFREELMEQLQPGLTWRLGKGGATRLRLDGMALVSGGAMLLPGEMTLNLRYWSATSWELVVYEEHNWKWDPNFNEYGKFPAHVGKETDPEQAVKALQLELVDVTKKKRSAVPAVAITGTDPLTTDEEAVSDDVAYSDAARKEFDRIPVLEMHIRFGPYRGLIPFQPVKIEKLKSTRERKKEGKKAKKEKMLLHFALHPAPLARTEWLEKFEGELTLGLLERGAPGDKPTFLVLTGGEDPTLWPVVRKSGEELDSLDGKRVETKTVPETVTADLDGTKLTIHLAKVDYVFDLWPDVRPQTPRDK